MTLLLWDQHTCLPLQPEAEVNLLTRFAGLARLQRHRVGGQRTGLQRGGDVGDDFPVWGMTMQEQDCN